MLYQNIVSIDLDVLVWVFQCLCDYRFSFGVFTADCPHSSGCIYPLSPRLLPHFGFQDWKCSLGIRANASKRPNSIYVCAS